MRSNKQIRIISGEFGGRLIGTPENNGKTQPMGDRERMAIFNRLREDIEGKRILDAFAGSGALGLEALSLGAAEVQFLERDSVAIRCIKDNLKKLDAEAELVREAQGEYDVIFADPPYDNPQYDYCQQLFENHLKSGGIFVLSHPAQPEPPIFAGELLSDKKYAAAHIKIYQK